MTALTYIRTLPRPGLRGVRAIATAIGAVAMHARRLAEAVKHRREAAMLAGFNDRMLSDIGLTRGDVAAAYSEPLWRDPPALLARRAGERQTARRRPGGRLRRLLSAPSLVPTDDGDGTGVKDHARRAARSA
ncbi:hypothetical protein CH338_13155 [Rhodoplanes elegans]|uniref:YjiS-like domain-containing protein n=1 Tax=Rhodoplanes elegans TaxID=29408 RepID=A0A327KLY6_9BRAD|nr:DUF1127 domain-containing protein [Rhodoplanes elegans]RAI38292.1 hypothetical protein CH338_13155 [Rhodoplanes elegans]